MNTLAMQLGAPFDTNWDALADVVCVLSWHGGVPGYVLISRCQRHTRPFCQVQEG